MPPQWPAIGFRGHEHLGITPGFTLFMEAYVWVASCSHIITGIISLLHLAQPVCCCVEAF